VSFSHGFFRLLGKHEKTRVLGHRVFSSICLVSRKKPCGAINFTSFLDKFYRKTSFVLGFAKKIGKQVSRVFSHIHFRPIAEKTRVRFNRPSFLGKTKKWFFGEIGPNQDKRRRTYVKKSKNILQFSKSVFRDFPEKNRLTGSHLLRAALGTGAVEKTRPARLLAEIIRQVEAITRKKSTSRSSRKNSSYLIEKIR
jgi:hypothetical protein